MSDFLKQKAKNMAKQKIKSMAKAGGKKLLVALAPYLPAICLFLLVFFMVAILVVATYSAMAPQSAMTGIEPSQEDSAIINDYKHQCNKYNVIDTYIVNEGEPSSPGGPNYESNPGSTYYPGKFTKVGDLIDKYGQDQKLKETWGQAHAANLYWAYTKGENKIPDYMREKTADELHPWFYYKESEVIVCGEDGCVTYITHLLVEAYTIQGHYLYRYKWVTETTSDGGSITKEVPDGVIQILPDKWQRLKDWMKKTYDIKDDEKELELSRSYVWEASKGFDSKKEWLEWIAAKWGAEGAASIVSTSTVPADIYNIVKDIANKYNIPYWFILAIIDQESSFDVNADNGSDNPHCYGLMQVSDSNWNEKAPKLGYDIVRDRDNPKAQIEVGTYMLSELGLKYVDWESGNWKDDSLPVLTFYYGAGKNLEKGRAEYAEYVWAKAERYRDVKAVWPVPGYYTITGRYQEVDDLHPKGHKGLDIAADEGATVVSASAGQVAFAGWEDPSDPGVGFGQFVIVRDATHDYYYGHLSEICVSPYQVLQPGDVVGKVGSTGRSTGPHLHFQVHDITGGIPGYTVDPTPYTGMSIQ